MTRIRVYVDVRDKFHTLPIGKYKAYQTRNCVILTYCCDLIKTKAIYYFVPYVFSYHLTNALIAMLTTYVKDNIFLKHIHNLPKI